ncbi:hypothetical protein MVEN_00489300 [Mycena venus]|uniref:Uncharacterized protein n=1 Tax=Mycena venus TaxID=2733690 RepID=A0A8H6YYG1_9AGAR|nr:hypothetical protein MVEN_00489300 [Mycena venus]
MLSQNVAICRVLSDLHPAPPLPASGSAGPPASSRTEARSVRGTSAPTKGKPITARVWTANNMKPLNVTLQYKGSSGVWLNRGDNLKALREAGLVANTTIEKYVFYMKRGETMETRELEYAASA